MEDDDSDKKDEEDVEIDEAIDKCIFWCCALVFLLVLGVFVYIFYRLMWVTYIDVVVRPRERAMSHQEL